MIAKLADAATALVDAATALGESGTEPRTKLAHYFDETATVLSSIVRRKMDGMQSVDLSAELELFGERIRDVAKPAIPAEDCERFYEALVRVKKARQMRFMTQYVEDHDYDGFADELSEMAAQFRALAKTLRELK